MWILTNSSSYQFMYIYFMTLTLFFNVTKIQKIQQNVQFGLVFQITAKVIDRFSSNFAWMWILANSSLYQFCGPWFNFQGHSDRKSTKKCTFWICVQDYFKSLWPFSWNLAGKCILTNSNMYQVLVTLT